MADIYRQRFESIKRITQKITSSLDIGQVLEDVRDEAQTICPKAKETCLIICDDQAKDYMRPMHCGVYRERISCRHCKRHRKVVQQAIAACRHTEETDQPGTRNLTHPCREAAFPILADGKVLAVLSLITDTATQIDNEENILLKDLADVATNVIRNAKQHWTVSQEKLTADKILGHIVKFVPETVTRIVEKNPDAPRFEKKEADVSVLFLDVAGYTRMSELLEKARLNFVIEKYFSGYVDDIYRFHGDINETAGDGLMVIFQDAEPGENALQALRTAAAIRRRTFNINRELAGHFDPVTINMGINSGTALLGMTHFNGSVGGRMTYTATGPVTNLASRIAGVARGGEILVGPETAKRLDGGFHCVSVGELNLKNVSDPVCLYRLTEKEPATSSECRRSGDTLN